MTVVGFQLSSHDYALFFQTKACGSTILLLYVNDMIIINDDTNGSRSQTVSHEAICYERLWYSKLFFGVEISSSANIYYLSQAKYVFELLTRAGLSDNKIANTLVEQNVKLRDTDDELL